MFKVKERPHDLLLLTAILFLLASFFTFDATVDFHLHDTYFVISLGYVFRATAGLLVLLWTLYKLTRRFLFSKIFTWIHIISTIITLLLIVGISFYSNHYYEGLAGKPRRYYDYSSWEGVLWYNNLAKAVVVTLLIFGLGVLAFLINLIIGLFEKLMNKAQSR